MALIRLILLIFLCSVVFCVEARQAAPVSGVLKNDSSQVQVRNFDSGRMQKYSNQEDFKYDANAVVVENAWRRFWNWFWSLLDDLYGGVVSEQLVTYIVAFLVAAFAVFGIVKFSGLDLKIFARRSKGIEVPYSESLENIHEIDFNEQIEAAIANSNFRLAVRLYYLRSLKNLNDRNLISWQPEKTNTTYVNEIGDRSIRQLFIQLTNSFEYVWYGDFYIDRDNFNLLKEQFDQFNKIK